MSEPLDLKTTAIIGTIIAAVIGGLKYFARWRTPEDARFDRGVRDELRKEIERWQRRYDDLVSRHDELVQRLDRMHQELLDEKRACAEKIGEMEEKMQLFIETAGTCARDGCPTRMSLSESGSFRRALRRESDENHIAEKKGN